MSLKSIPGGPSPAAIAQTRTNAKAASGVSNKYAVVEGSSQASNEFPYVPFAPDSYDDTALIKQHFSQAAVGDNWVVPFTEQDASYVKRQRDQMENADFDRWVMQKFDLGDPAQLFLFQQIAPEQFQRRMDLIDYQQNIVTKYAKTRLMGARSLEDLKFEWLIETGRIELPKGPIWDPVQWMSNQMNAAGYPQTGHGLAERAADNRSRYMSGLFSPLKMLTENQVGWQPDPHNRGDVRGNSNSKTYGQLFEGSLMEGSSIRYGESPIRDNKVRQYYYNTNGGSYGGRFEEALRPGVDVYRAPQPMGPGYGRPEVWPVRNRDGVFGARDRVPPPPVVRDVRDDIRDEVRADDVAGIDLLRPIGADVPLHA